jgi:putative phage-type endonuclease
MYLNDLSELQEITNNFSYTENTKDTIDIPNNEFIKFVYSLIEIYFDKYFYKFYKTDFINICCNDIYSILIHTLPNYDYINLQEIKYTINEYINENILLYGIPERQQKFTVNKLTNDFQHIKQQIDYLTSLQQSEQKSETWHNERSNKLTASNIYKAIDSEAQLNSLIVEKCKPYIPLPLNINSPKHHGEKYEPLAVIYYEYMYNTKVGEFGLIFHKEYDFLAASPDGINIDPNSPLFGRMIEIKNIVNRELNGIPINAYWVQMQIQMEVCDLDFCDFLECDFKEYENEEQFLNDGSFNLTKDNQQKGSFIRFMKSDGTPFYQYPTWNCSKEDYKLWEIETMEKHKNLTWVSNIYWKLVNVSLVTVSRNHFWYNNAHYKFKEVHSIIQKEKISGFEHRLPKKRPVKTTKKKDTTNNNNKNEIIINIET